MNRIALVLVAMLMLVLGIGSMVYTINQCGFWEAMLLGKNGFWVALSGMCN